MLLKHNRLLKGTVLACLLLVSSCTKAPPNQVDNICKIFKQYPKWYWASNAVAKRWRVPTAVQMAIIHQESRFNATAKPPRTKLLWVIPWTRPSSAYGYSQALKETWEHYKKQAGSRFASRDAFDDAVDFIGWYVDMANRKLSIPRNDTYKLYLAYHEGIGGYSRGTFHRKPWLMNVARKVNHRAVIYDNQLRACRSRLKEKPWYRIW